MFRCSDCRQVSQPGESAHKVVRGWRAKEYKDDRGRTVGRGREAVNEEMVCPRCTPQAHMARSQVGFLPAFLRRDGDGRVRLNTEEAPA